MKHYVPVILVAVVSVLVGGCALSPQEIDANPRIVLEQQVGPYPGVVAVTVYDERGSNTLGSRGGVYDGTNPITTSPKLPLTMRSAIELSLREMGIRVTDSDKAAQLEVYLDSLEYQVPEGNYITQVDLRSKVRVRVVSNGREFEGSYGSSLNERVPTAPSDTKNTELVERVLSDVLGRAFSDPKLHTFLASIEE